VLKLKALIAGSCSHPEKLALSGGGIRSVRFPSSVAVIEHPKEGVILLDTGYSPRFEEITRKLQGKLYSWISNVQIDPQQTAAEQLLRAGISPSDVRLVVLSHFHGDHLGGVADFTKARFVYFESALHEFETMQPLQARLKGFLGELLPKDFGNRSEKVELSQLQPFHRLPGFSHGVSLLADGSIWLIPLPGHAPGHTGLWFESEDGPEFLVADACWRRESFEQLRFPNPLASLLFEDAVAYRSTLRKLYTLHLERPEIRITPCHCENSIAQLQPL
jgi:glyoxylase-like metal-dependent hydrolase (beta-lactamase superfamily II)